MIHIQEKSDPYLWDKVDASHKLGIALEDMLDEPDYDPRLDEDQEREN